MGIRTHPTRPPPMDTIPEVDTTEAKALLDAGDTIFMDVRDPASFAAAHVPGAQHVNDHNVQQFVAETDPGAKIVVYCYHGHSSLGGAAFLMEQGFEDVASLRGGFEAWRREHDIAKGAPD